MTAATCVPLRKAPPGMRHPCLSEESRRRVMEAGKDCIEEWGSGWKWEEEHWRYLPIEAFDTLTISEKMELAYSTIILTDLMEGLIAQEPARLFERVRLCLWYNGAGNNWNDLVDAYTKVCSFDFNEPGFHVTVDHPRGYQSYGTGLKSGRWLDGGLAYILHFKGEPVAILGFSMSTKGVLIQQAQMIKKKGNRWLYKLRGSLLEVMVTKFKDHFGDPLWIVDGASNVSYLRKLYADHPNKLTEEDAARIEAYYNAPLHGISRTWQKFETFGHLTGPRTYMRLRKNVMPTAKNVQDHIQEERDADPEVAAIMDIELKKLERARARTQARKKKNDLPKTSNS